ncbi:unnamed protein product [Ostreobium quekettii]|uniref:Uncharacterized protein n=1 Tax=Ostreobium quekettii TaxID=121088 RepID=A0A8S1J570_9CHLO|nr:unnamed protein product [Ostreobium quekettii]
MALVNPPQRRECVGIESMWDAFGAVTLGLEGEGCPPDGRLCRLLPSATETPARLRGAIGVGGPPEGGRLAGGGVSIFYALRLIANRCTGGCRGSRAFPCGVGPAKGWFWNDGLQLEDAWAPLNADETTRRMTDQEHEGMSDRNGSDRIR